MKLQTKTGKLVPVDSRQDPETRKRQQVAQAALDLLEHGVHDNVADALGHAAVNLVNLDDLMRATSEAARVGLAGRYEEGGEGGYLDFDEGGDGWN